MAKKEREREIIAEENWYCIFQEIPETWIFTFFLLILQIH